MNMLYTYTSAFNALTTWRRSSMPSAFDPLTGMRLEPLESFVCFAENGDEDEDTETPGKTYTKDDIERIVKQRLKKAEKETASLSSRAEKAEKAAADALKKLEELNEKFENSNKSDVEKELAKAQRESAQLKAQMEKLAQEHAEATQKATQAEAGLQRTRLETTLRDALRQNKAHGKGMDQAVRLMLDSGAAFDDDGGFVMKVGDVPYEKPDEAAKKWLEENPHFMEGSGGGSGTPRGGNGKLVTPAQMDDMSPGALIAAGLKTNPG